MSGVTNRKKQSYAAVQNTEEEEDELSEKEIRLLKREARKRKWVRRCKLVNDYVHATCKSIMFIA